MKKYKSNVIITNLRIEEGTNTNYFVKFKGENSLKDYSLFETDKEDDAIVVKHDIEYPITSDMYILIKTNIRDNYQVEIKLKNITVVEDSEKNKDETEQEKNKNETEQEKNKNETEAEKYKIVSIKWIR